MSMITPIGIPMGHPLARRVVDSALGGHSFGGAARSPESGSNDHSPIRVVPASFPAGRTAPLHRTASLVEMDAETARMEAVLAAHRARQVPTAANRKHADALARLASATAKCELLAAETAARRAVIRAGNAVIEVRKSANIPRSTNGR
jgi:hypothetical protein